MGNSLRCCVACILPCGALDLIRIVHLNGYVEEITRPITAGEVLKANPNHVLSKPTSQGAVVRRILILSPDTELKRGSIYFLIPSSSLPPEKNKKKRNAIVHADTRHLSTTKTTPSSKKRSINNSCSDDHDHDDGDNDGYSYSKQHHVYNKEKKSSRRDRRKGRVGIWRPHLESISED